MALNSGRAAFGNEPSLRQLLILYSMARTRKPPQQLDDWAFPWRAGSEGSSRRQSSQSLAKSVVDPPEFQNISPAKQEGL
jgi:hypothetical protein